MDTGTSFLDWARKGRLSPHIRTIRSSGKFLGVVEGYYPAGDISSPAGPDLILAQDLGPGGVAITGDLGAGSFRSTSTPSNFSLVAPNFSNTVILGGSVHCRAFSFNPGAWQAMMDDGSVALFSFDYGRLHKSMFESHNLSLLLQKLNGLIADEGEVSLLLSQAAGIEILVELRRLAGIAITPARGGLSPSAERRCVELMHNRLADDISVVELANEARLSPFHFTRMFKKSVGMSPRAYLVHLRVQKACDLLQNSDLSILEIALEVGYSSSQVLARVFQKHMKLAPSEYRLATRV